MSASVSIRRSPRAGAIRASVIVPSLSGAVTALRASLATQTFQDFELIVVVGARPAARARNLGVASASGDILVFVDDDARFGHPEVLGQLVERLEADPGVGVVGPSKILSAAATPRQRRVAAEVPRWVYPVVAADTESNPPLDRYGFSGITTTCCAMRRAAFAAAGGFDEGLLTGEDPELFFRLRQAGYRFVIPARCWVHHDPPAALGDLLRKSYGYGVGHAQEAHKHRGRRMDVVPTTGVAGGLLLLVAPLLLPLLLFAQPYFEPARHWRLGFRPLKALVTLSTFYGYALETRRLRRRAAPAAEEQPAAAGHSASRSSTIAGLSFLGVAVLNNVYAILMAALLPVAAFGVLGLAQAWLLIAATLLNAGFPWELARVMARGGARDEIGATAKGALLGNLALAVALSGVLLAATHTDALALRPADEPIVWLLVAATLLLAVAAVGAGLLQGGLRFGAVGAARLAEAAVKLGAGALLALAGLGAFGAVAAMAAGAAVAVAILAWAARRLARWRAPGWGSLRNFRSALTLLVGLCALTLLSNLDIIGVKLFSPAAESDTLAGYYQTAAVLARIPLLLAGAYAGALFPYLSRSAGAALGAYTRQTLKYALLLLAPLHLILIAIPDAALGLLFPARYQASAGALRIAAAGTLLLSLATVMTMILQARGRARVPALWLLVAVAGQLVALALLVPGGGIEGAALSLVAGGALAVAGLAPATARLVAASLPALTDGGRLLAVRAAGYGLACGLLVLTLLALPHRGALGACLAALLALAVYGAVLAATGALRSSDLVTLTSGLPLGRIPLAERLCRLGLGAVARLNRLAPGAERREPTGP
jgi:O-antigen/teichoic acid export membrane protein